MVLPESNLGSGMFVTAGCVAFDEARECPSATGDPNGYAAAVYVYAADIVLEQNVGPTAGNVGGELASGASVKGTADVSFSASDPGSGVWRALFYVDGHLVQTTPLDENGGRCRNVGETTDGLPAFLYVQPCVASLDADVGLDTTGIANGSHQVVVDVEDAAGNVAPVLDRTVTVDNPPSPCVAGALRMVSSSAAGTLRVGWKASGRGS